MNKPENITTEWIEKEYADLKLRFENCKTSNWSCNTFILNPEMQHLQAEITQLRRLCPHKYENNECIYCHKKNIGGDNNE